jgi:hypothetical protein
MNNVPPDHERPDDADELYRRASALDVSRPSESVRRAVLEHAAQLARQRAPTSPASRAPLRRLFAYAGRRPAAFGTLAAAVVAGLLVLPTWRMLSSRLEEPTASLDQVVTVTAARRDTVPPSAQYVPVPRAQPAPAAPATRIPERPLGAGDAVGSRRTLSGYLTQRRAAPPAAAAVPENAAPQGGPAGGAASADRSVASKEEMFTNSPITARVAPITAAPAAEGGVMAQAPAPAPAEQPAAEPKAVQEAVVTQSTATRGLAAPVSDQAEAFRRAAEKGDLVTLEALLGKQASIDARDAEGRTALMRAILGGQAQAVDALLAYGADPNLADRRGVTPLAAALAGNNATILQALRHHGAR